MHIDCRSAANWVAQSKHSRFLATWGQHGQAVHTTLTFCKIAEMIWDMWHQKVAYLHIMYLLGVVFLPRSKFKSKMYYL